MLGDASRRSSRYGLEDQTPDHELAVLVCRKTRIVNKVLPRSIHRLIPAKSNDNFSDLVANVRIAHLFTN
jgi:hypothetical protein